MSKPKIPRKTPGKAVPKRGRPTVYQASYAEQAHRLALLGQTDAEQAAFFGISESTFHLWKQRHPEFSESIKSGKENADSQVATSLYRSALGDGVITEVREQTDEEGNVTGRTKETRQVQASVTAMIFWLKNRQPDKWRDRVDHEVDVTLEGPNSEELSRLYVDTMAKARARQEAMLAERGLIEEPGRE